MLQHAANVGVGGIRGEGENGPGAAWESGTAAARAAFACWKADTMVGDQESLRGLPAKAAVRGAMVRATPGRNLL